MIKDQSLKKATLVQKHELGGNLFPSSLYYIRPDYHNIGYYIIVMLLSTCSFSDTRVAYRPGMLEVRVAPLDLAAKDFVTTLSM